MALGDPYATLAQLKARLGISDTSDDTALTNALAASTLALEGATGRQFNDAGSATARVFYPDSQQLVYVDDFSTSSGLIVQADFGNDGTYEYTYNSTNYQLEPLNGIFDGTPNWAYNRIRAINAFFPLFFSTIGGPRASIQVTARWGWASVPAPIVEACLMLAEETFKMKDAPFGVAGFTDYGPVRVRDNPKVMGLIGRYIRNRILAV